MIPMISWTFHGCSHGNSFVEKVLSIDDAQDCEAYVERHYGEEISINGVVKEVMEGNIATGWFFYMTTPEIDTHQNDPMEIQVNLDERELLESVFLNEEGGKAICVLKDRSPMVIEPGIELKITGIIWGYRHHFANDERLLWIANGVLNK